MLMSLNCPADANSPVKERLVGKDPIFQVELVLEAVVSHLQKKPKQRNQSGTKITNTTKNARANSKQWNVKIFWGLIK
jgi:hypothetical protein